MNIESKTEHIGFRVHPALASVINQCVAEGGWKSKSEMLRELFLDLSEQIKNEEVAQLTEDTKR